MQPVAPRSGAPRRLLQAGQPVVPAPDLIVLVVRAAWWLLAAVWAGHVGGFVPLPERLRLSAWWIMLAGAGVLLAELAIAGLALVQSRPRSCWHRQYFLLRVPHPLRAGRVGMPVPGATEFWHALHGFACALNPHAAAPQIAL
ncbi:MAG TPA: hypothetical protein VFT99_00925, partial [Roseiflexaceae bacterium]|nr:hypothetical protein [Roseiflexaceae bacterium]